MRKKNYTLTVIFYYQSKYNKEHARVSNYGTYITQ